MHTCIPTPPSSLPPNTRSDSGHTGHTFQVVGWGRGLFGESSKGEEDEDGGTGTTGTTWNLENPMRRDTVTVPAFSHVVIRFVADNPGLWALHCHVAWHMEGKPVQSPFSRQAPLSSPYAASTHGRGISHPRPRVEKEYATRPRGMFVSLAERPGDLVELVDGMDPETRRLSQSFCGMRGDQQASGVDDADYDPPT
ncbi:hypothetical protein DL769_004219 [Monosporascus sp. CRB-8-3]|nr:hypothetical protein DL769_004219 [Monosporascus sp. CRB-8-3]